MFAHNMMHRLFFLFPLFVLFFVVFIILWTYQQLKAIKFEMISYEIYKFELLDLIWSAIQWTCCYWPVSNNRIVNDYLCTSIWHIRNFSFYLREIDLLGFLLNVHLLSQGITNVFLFNCLYENQCGHHGAIQTLCAHL